MSEPFAALETICVAYRDSLALMGCERETAILAAARAELKAARELRIAALGLATITKSYRGNLTLLTQLEAVSAAVFDAIAACQPGGQK